MKHNALLKSRTFFIQNVQSPDPSEARTRAFEDSPESRQVRRKAPELSGFAWSYISSITLRYPVAAPLSLRSAVGLRAMQIPVGAPLRIESCRTVMAANQSPRIPLLASILPSSRISTPAICARRRPPFVRPSNFTRRMAGRSTPGEYRSSQTIMHLRVNSKLLLGALIAAVFSHSPRGEHAVEGAAGALQGRHHARHRRSRHPESGGPHAVGARSARGGRVHRWQIRLHVQLRRRSVQHHHRDRSGRRRKHCRRSISARCADRTA